MVCTRSIIFFDEVVFIRCAGVLFNEKAALSCAVVGDKIEFNHKGLKFVIRDESVVFIVIPEKSY